MLARILLAWDGSAAVRRALGLALDLARRYDAEIVAATLPHATAHPEIAWRREGRGSGCFQAAGLESLRHQARRAGVRLEQIVIEDDQPARGLLRVARDRGFDLVVVGRPTRRAAQRILPAGLAEALAGSAGVPVLVVGVLGSGRS